MGNSLFLDAKKGLALIITMLILLSAFSKDKNSLWCFTLSNSQKGVSIESTDDFSVKYLEFRTKKWKSVKKQNLGWGYQPDVTLERCYQFYAPANLRAIEIVIYYKQERKTILIDQFPDTLSRHPLIAFLGINIQPKQTEMQFSELKSVKVAKYINKENFSLDLLKKRAKIQTDLLSYPINRRILVYIESSDSNELVQLYGCGTPATLYRVQQWIQGDWTDFRNTWGLKCGHEKFVIKRYIMGFSLDRKGIFRVVFDSPNKKENNLYELLSNPFLVE